MSLRFAVVVVVLGSGAAHAQADAGTELLLVRPPLGRLNAVMDPPEAGGVPTGEVAVRGAFAGCETPHTFYLSRAVTLGAAKAGEQLGQWLQQEPGVKKKLFGAGAKKDPLTEAVRKAREGTFSEGRACRVETKPTWTVTYMELASPELRIAAREAPAGLCKHERPHAETGGVWLFAKNTQSNVKKKDFSAAVAFGPPAEGAKNPCLPRLSIALFDDAGMARLRYHADYNGALEVELLGDGCQRVVFAFDAGRQVFVPTADKDPQCPAGKKAK